jgi:hypothetical protein
MSIQLQMEQMHGYLAARFIGSGVAEEAWRQFELIAEHCKSTKNNKVLIDFERAEAEVSLLDRFMMGESGRIFAIHRIKVAGVDTPERMDPERFARLVARNRGVNVEAFTDLQAAEEWLLK